MKTLILFLATLSWSWLALAAPPIVRNQFSTNPPSASATFTPYQVGGLTATGTVTAANFIGNAAGLTNVPNASATNLWVVDTPFTLGQTNWYKSQGAVTAGLTGVINQPTSTSGFGELYILATGDITFTNPVAWVTSDGLDTRTITNGNVAAISVIVMPGAFTNLFIVKSW